MKKLRILIVEANIHFSAALARVMERDGHFIVGTADHALGAMALAIAFKPDLALVEVNLSDGCSGAELGNLLAQQGISVVFVTAARDFTPASDANIVGVLAKPAGDTALLAAVRSVLPRDARSSLAGAPAVMEEVSPAGLPPVSAGGSSGHTPETHPE